MRRLCDGSVQGSILRCRRNTGVTPIAAGNRDDRVENCDMDDRHRPARARGPVLFAEDPCFTFRERCMIETTGVDRDLIPVTDGVYVAILSAGYLAASRRSPKAWTQCITVTPRETLRP